MEFSFCDTFHCIPIFNTQGDLFGVVPGPKNKFYIESKNCFTLFIEDMN